jgi:plasmid stabilization system protein ParE
VPIKFGYTVDAQRMVDEADERWISEHGYDGDNPLLSDIEHARDLLLDNPELGIAVQHDGRLRGVVRRLLLGSGWHLYYRFRVEQQQIEILAVWFAARGGGPPL